MEEKAIRIPIRILILPGDGIGPEITRATTRVLETLDRKLALGLELTRRDIGLASLETEGTTWSASALEQARQADGVVLGPVSTYDYPPPSQGGINPSAAIRISLDLYANIRPAWTRHGVPSVAPQMDLVVVRENTEGHYADRNMVVGGGEFQPTEDVALSVRKITTAACERIARAAFELAARRRKSVTMVHKANVLKVTDGLFARTVERVARDYPDIELGERLIDAMCAYLVRTPEAFDVIVTTNMYGDILSDEAGELAGGLGLAPALNAGDEHAIAQAAHGSAPDIAGKGIANPTALILSAGMLLEWLGDRHGRQPYLDAGNRLRAAVDAALSEPANHTPDLGGSATTEGLTDAVVAALEE